MLHIPLYLYVQCMQGIVERSLIALAELYMYLQEVRFWEKTNYPCVAKAHIKSLKFSLTTR